MQPEEVSKQDLAARQAFQAKAIIHRKLDRSIKIGPFLLFATLKVVVFGLVMMSAFKAIVGTPEVINGIVGVISAAYAYWLFGKTSPSSYVTNFEIISDLIKPNQIKTYVTRNVLNDKKVRENYFNLSDPYEDYAERQIRKEMLWQQQKEIEALKARLKSVEKNA
jgi:hypothetical protein